MCPSIAFKTTLVPEHRVRDITMRWKRYRESEAESTQKNEMTVWRQCGKSHIYSGNRRCIHTWNCVKTMAYDKIHTERKIRKV